MKNMLYIGQRSFILNPDGTYLFTGGLERMTNTFLSILQYDYNIYFMYNNGRSYSSDTYKKEYPWLSGSADIKDKIEDLRDILSNRKIDIVMISGWMSSEIISAIDIICETDIPVLLYSHGTNMGTPDQYKACINKKNFYIACCTSHEEQDNINIGIPRDRIFRINNPVDIKYNDNYEFSSNDKMITISRMQVGKGIPNSMEITTRINKTLDIIGKKYRGYVVRQLANMYDSSTYNCLGTMDRDLLINTVKNYELSFLLPNEKEGMNLSCLECNALGVPVVVWNDWAFPDFLDHEFNIFLDHNMDTYVDQFLEQYYPNINFYLDPDNRKELSKRTFDNFGIEVYKKNLYKILDTVCK